MKYHSFTTNEYIKYAYQLASVLDYLHKDGYYHNDLKLDNLFLDKEKNLILGDFSISFSTLIDIPSEVHANVYRIPEEEDKNKLSTRNDIWAYACVLHTMIYKKYFFGSSSIDQKQNKKEFLQYPDIYLDIVLNEEDIFTPFFRKLLTLYEKQVYTSFEEILKDEMFQTHMPKTIIPYKPNDFVPIVFLFTTLKPKMYHKLFRWLLCVSVRMNLHIHTYFFAIQLICRYTSKMNTEVNEFQLVGIVGLLLASQMYEHHDYMIGLEYAKYVCLDIYTIKQVEDMYGNMMFHCKKEEIPYINDLSLLKEMLKSMLQFTEDDFNKTVEEMDEYVLPETFEYLNETKREKIETLYLLKDLFPKMVVRK
jgi:hypothetical protein